MTKLTDLQLVLLSTGAQREDGALLPLPPAITATTARLTQAVATLVRRGLAAAADNARSAVITDAGREAIGVPPVAANYPDEPAAAAATAPDVPSPAVTTKSATVIGLMRRPCGASLTELVEATSWLPHTMRAALTGLRKKDHAIARDKADGITRYRIAA